MIEIILPSFFHFLLIACQHKNRLLTISLNLKTAVELLFLG
ncbi:MAG: hypothetical protein ACD_62C00316G0001, partial [uncultured bacterium]